jgi:heme-degrading monooxygenase HmoA
MFVVTNRVFVAHGFEQEFESRFQKRAGQIENNPGFVRMEILKPISANTPYAVVTYWENQSAFDAWVQSEDFKLAHQNPMPKEAFAGEGKLERFEVIISAQRS